MSLTDPVQKSCTNQFVLNVLREFLLHIRVLRKILRQNMSGQFYSTIIFAGATAMEEVHEEKMAHF